MPAKRIIFTVILLLAISSSAQAALTLKFDSQSRTYKDPSEIHVMFYGGSIDATYNGGTAIALKTDYTLQDIGSSGITLNSYIAGVVYISLGEAMKEGRTSEPSFNNPNDADYNKRWDRYEITYTGGDGNKADLTGINAFAIPLQLETSKGGTTKETLTYDITGNAMISKLGAVSNNDPTAVLKDGDNFLRVIGPTTFPNGQIGPYNSFDNYVTSVKNSNQSTAIKDQYDGIAGATTNRQKPQPYDFTVTFDGAGDLKMAGGGSLVGYSHTIIIPGGASLAYQVYATNPSYTIDGNSGSMADNDVYAAAVRDILAGFAIGYVGSSVTDTNTGQEFKDEDSDKWFASNQPLAFAGVQPSNKYFNEYAEVFWLYSNSYGFPFSDKLHKLVQAEIGPTGADTLTMTVLPDVTTYPQSVTLAISNADAPADWRAPEGSIVTIPDPGDIHGLKYTSDGKLIVRTVETSANLSNNYVGQPNYTISGSPTTDAAPVTTGNNFTVFYDTKGGEATNGDLINVTERGFGMNDTGIHNAIIEFAVNPDNNTMMRLTKNPDITSYQPDQYGNDDTTYPFLKPSDMSTVVYNNFVAYYDNWRTEAYTQPYDANKSAPFTQLGYTYFWGYGAETILSDIQGMSEFILLGGTSADIHGIYATPSYIYTKNNGQYGNGYASFDITGDCDTVWAGHRFQQGVNRSASNPNHITISSDTTMSGGEGILVWSLNYDITNNGIITGATSDKFGIAGTSNIAILFKGDTGSSYGTPVTEGGNKLINSGMISSTETAVKSENGNTSITNNSGATISGGTYGIWLLNGTNDITNNGTITGPGTAAIRIGAGKTAITSNGTISGNIVLDAEPTAALDVGSSNLTLSGNYTQGAGSTLSLTANSSADYGNITASGAVLDPASKVDITVNGYIPNNTAFKVVDTSGSGVGNLPGTITEDSAVLSFSGSTASGDLIIAATRANSYNSFATSPNAKAVASTLQPLAMNNTATGDMVTVLGALDSMASQEEIDAALESMQPNVDNSIPQTTQAGLNQFVSMSVSRLDNFQDAASKDLPKSTTSSQDALSSYGSEIWAQEFGTYIHQDPMDLSNGYNATIWGTALGFDIPIEKVLKVGASGGFSQSFIRTKDSSARSDINSYQGALYGTYGWTNFFIDVLGAFAYNTYDSSRHVPAGTIDRTANGNYDGQQYSAYVGGGYKIDVKDYTITPVATFQYTHIRIDGYEETGAGALNLKVDSQDLDVAQTGLGVKLARTFENKNYTFVPEVRFKWFYDWIGDAQQVTSTFTGGGAAFQTTGFTPAQSSYNLGTKLMFIGKNNLTLSVNYDLELKEDFYGHSGFVEFRYMF